MKFVKYTDVSKWNLFLKLSDCCFGVYIFQQFILLFINRTKLAQNICPYIYPWITFSIALIISLALTVIIRKTRIGRKLL